MIDNDIVVKIAGDIVGTCGTLSDTCAYHGVSEDDFTEENWNTFNEIVFECEGCGWWCEVGERNYYDGEDVCDDCYDEKNYEEED